MCPLPGRYSKPRPWPPHLFQHPMVLRQPRQFLQHRGIPQHSQVLQHTLVQEPCPLR
jgi:hypothetical protein